ncbi:N,N-dimethylformamidase beta subunit family domain-containing protein [Stigmatella aurantiaca]|nr:N,N-dimethylformamidase beta subunit family domain-containing protein [Stigmatella aurantiaca]EAU68042.1 hypothetical protein STIAU_5116 [Stigmatella aurantiaca DW4/3-1]
MGAKTPWGLAVLGVLWACSVQDMGAGRLARQQAPSPHGEQRAATRVDPPVSERVRFVRANGAEVLRGRRGDPSWRRGQPAKPEELEVHVSQHSAQLGEPVSVNVSTPDASVLRMEVFRLGFYGGAGALKVWDGGALRVDPQETFSFAVGEDWVPGLYLVKVTRADGLRSFRSLVVKARRGTEPRT